MPWSAWQPGFAFTAPAKYQAGDGSLSDDVQAFPLASVVAKDPTLSGYTSFADAISDVSSMLTEAVSPTDPVGVGSGWSQLFSISQDLTILPTVEIGSSVELFQWVASFLDPDYSGYQPAPTLPPGVTVYEYEAGDSTRTGWADWTLTSTDDNYSSESDLRTTNEGSDPQDVFFDDWAPYVSFRFTDLATLSFEAIYESEIGGHGTSNTFPTDMWPAPSIGTETYRLTHTLSTVDATVDEGPVTATLAAVGNVDSFTIILQPSTLGEGEPPLHTPTANPADSLLATSASDQFSGDFGEFLPRPPNLIYVTPRWRYWIDQAVYTVGGHWADPNGVVVMVLKDDGVTWIPIVDGLAPPLL
jgi:hypothetical protein